MYLYRAVDSDGNTVEFMLSRTRDAMAAKRFFRKALRAPHTVAPRVINVDRNPSYPKAVGKLKKEGTLQKGFAKAGGAERRLSLWGSPSFSRSIRRGRRTAFGRGEGMPSLVARICVGMVPRKSTKCAAPS
jgi:transposase-like protein